MGSGVKIFFLMVQVSTSMVITCSQNSFAVLGTVVELWPKTLNQTSNGSRWSG